MARRAVVPPCIHTVPPLKWPYPCQTHHHQPMALLQARSRYADPSRSVWARLMQRRFGLAPHPISAGCEALLPAPPGFQAAA